MKPFRNPFVFLVGANILLWGLAFSANRIQAVFVRFATPSFTLPSVALRPSGDSPGRPRLNAPNSSAETDSLLADPLLDDLSSLDRDPPLKPAQVELAHRQTRSQRILSQSTTHELTELSTPLYNYSDNFFARLSKADGLGGEVSLKTLSEPQMPIAAKVERLQHQRSSDQLSALPLHWREPLRQELAKRPAVSKVATVRIPVPDLPERYEVPVIIDETGRADGLSQPENRKAQEAVEKWLTRQKPSKAGTVSVMVVSAEPMASASDDSEKLATSAIKTSIPSAQLPPSGSMKTQDIGVPGDLANPSFN